MVLPHPNKNLTLLKRFPCWRLRLRNSVVYLKRQLSRLNKMWKRNRPCHMKRWKRKVRRNLNVRYVGTIATWAVGLLRGISRNSVTSMACGALASRIRKTSTKSLIMRKRKNCGKGYRRGKE